MARVTVTDCLEHVDNRFELVLVAAKRARQLLLGAPPKVDPGEPRDKDTVIALREIAAGHIDASILEQPEIADAESMFNDPNDGPAEPTDADPDGAAAGA